MRSSREVAEGLLDFRDEEFFGDIEESFGSLENQLLDLEFEGLAISAPRLVSADQEPSLPVVMATRKSLSRAYEVMQMDNCFFVSADLNTGEVVLAQAFPDLEQPLPGPVGPRPPLPPDIVEGATARLYLLDAYPRLGLPWRPRRMALTVVSYDWVSNTVEVELTGNHEPETGGARWVHPQPAQQPMDGEDEDLYPSYLQDDRNPEIPDDGLDFTIDTQLAKSAGLLVRGAFSLIARQCHVPEELESHAASDGRIYEVGAAVPATLAIVALDWKVPEQFECWALPAYASRAARPGDRISGCFAIDALADTKMRLAPGEYLAFMIMDGVVHGPVEFEMK
jgi:hypothetical protein